MKNGFGKILLWIVFLIAAYWLYSSNILGDIYKEYFPDIVREILKEVLRDLIEHIRL